jgi:hypothetical protein
MGTVHPVIASVAFKAFAISCKIKTYNKPVTGTGMEVIPGMQVRGILDTSSRKRAGNLGIYKASLPVL